MKKVLKMRANILGFNAKLPEIIYLDSSFILNIAIDGAKYFRECADFMKRLEKENIPSAISSFSLDEVWYGLIRASLIKDYPSDWLDKLRSEPQIIKNYMQLIKNAARDLILLHNIIVVETKTDTVMNSMNYIEKYFLLPRDAIHLATMLELGIKNIATTDADFGRIPEINVYTCKNMNVKE